MYRNKCFFASLFLLFFSSFLTHICFAQVWGLNEEYAFEYQTSSPRSLIVDNSELIVLGNIGTDTNGLAGMYYLRLDTFGNTEKLKFYQDPDMKRHIGLQKYGGALIDQDRNIFSAGIKVSGGNLFLLKIDSLGNQIFNHQYTTEQANRYNGTLLKVGNNFFSLGMSGSGSENVDVIVNKVDSQGNSFWEKRYGIADGGDYCYGGIAENHGISFLMRSNKSNEIQTKLIHIDTLGNIQWEFETEINEELIPFQIVKFKNDYLYNIRTAKVIDNTLHTGAQLVCRDSNFNLKWRTKVLDTLLLNELGDFTIGPDSMIYAVGSEITLEDITRRAVIFKIDPEDGEIIWKVDGPSDFNPIFDCSYYLESVAAHPDGNIFIAGRGCDSVSMKNYTIVLKITPDGCMETICTTTSLDELIPTTEKLYKMYPNPANDIIQIDIIPDVIYLREILITDLQGKIVFKNKLTQKGSKVNIQVNDIPQGIYFLTGISNDNLIQTEKIVIQR